MILITVDELISLIHQNLPVIDVRSPSEFLQGHIPGAVNIPLFDDHERAIVGTIYKQKGREDAIVEALRLVGPKLSAIPQRLIEEFTGKKMVVHCWRGGRRSQSMAWLFELIGKEVYVLEGGYKSFRHKVQENLSLVKLRLKVLGGKTGSGKTIVIKQLKYQNQQVLDLEELADHKGSAFGWIGRTKEVGTEMLENKIWYVLNSFDLNKTIWIENESRGIGIAQIPENIWQQMRVAPLFHIEMDVEERLNILIDTYCFNNKEELSQSFERIRKKLGHEKTDKALELVLEGQFREAARLALDYYDKTYLYNLHLREQSLVKFIPVKNFNPEEIARRLIELEE